MDGPGKKQPSNCFKLKDSNVVRVFISSPFRGLEEERNELSTKCWPQLSSLCAKQGLDFRVVDMRWGITAESGQSAQTIRICLQELDRSDIFVGFFAQRYGWKGLDDAELQENFDVALPFYPWINNYRNKSVTELEFLHGYLNEGPSAIPACFCFRDKKYDDKLLQEGILRGDESITRKYKIEDEEAELYLNDLKKRIYDSKERTLGVEMSYQTPKVGAKFMFECVKDFVKKFLLEQGSGEEVPIVQKIQQEHLNFCRRSAKPLVGAHNVWEELESHTSTDVSVPLFILGPAGSGKSCIVSNWLNKILSENMQVIYYFVGATVRSLDTSHLLKSLIVQLDSLLKKNTATDKLNSIQLGREVYQKIEELKDHSHQVIIIIEGLNRINVTSKIGQSLFWLPTVIPLNVKVVLSSTKESHIVTEAQEKFDKFISVEVTELALEDQMKISLNLLRENSKEFSSKQLKAVVDAEMTKNPLFLRIVIEELCVLGNFRKLDKQIESLVSSESLSDLFQKVLERLENINFSVKDQVCEILQFLFVCKYGLSESQLMKLAQISQADWSTFYFSFEKYLQNNDGLYWISYDELKSAIERRYFDSPGKRVKQTAKLATALLNVLKMKRDAGSNHSTEVLHETPYLLVEANMRHHLAKFLSNWPVVKFWSSVDQYQWLDFWKSTGMTQAGMSKLLLNQSMEMTAQGYYSEKQDNAENMYLHLRTISDMLMQGKLYDARGVILSEQRGLVERMLSRDNDSAVWNKYFVSALYEWACHLINSGQIEEGEQAHRKVIKQLEVRDDVDMRSNALHGLGVAAMERRRFQEALDYLKESSAVLQKETSVCRQNLGLCYLELCDYSKAMEYYMAELKNIEHESFGSYSPELARILLNIGLLYRRMNDLDKAYDYYTRSLNLTIKGLGHDHVDVGMAYLNLGTLSMIRNDLEKDEYYCRKAFKIFEEKLSESHAMYISAIENLACSLHRTNQMEEGEKLFWRMFKIRQKYDLVHLCLPHYVCQYVSYYIKQEMFDKANDVLTILIDSEKRTLESYLLLDQLDTLSKRSVPREHHYSLEHATTLWPGNQELFHRVACSLIASEKLPELFGLADRYGETQNFDHGGVVGYSMIIDILREKGLKEMAHTIVTKGLEKDSQALCLWQQMYNVLVMLGRKEEAFPWIEKCVEEKSDFQPFVRQAAKDAALVMGDPDRIKKYCKILEENWGDKEEVKSQVKVLTETMEYLHSK